MNAVDATEHYETSARDPAPALLTVILDTNPRAWALLEESLPLSQAIANILVFLNAHLACNYANEVAVVASHNQKATWLYPSGHNPTPYSSDGTTDRDGDVAMNGPDNTNSNKPPKPEDGSTTGIEMNKYRPFRIVEEQVTQNLRHLLESTTSADVQATSSTMMAGALTLALSHINRRTIAWNEAHGGDTSGAAGPGGDRSSGGVGGSSGSGAATTDAESLQSRILIISVSSSTDSAHQYIPIMNGIFACQRLHIPIDVCKLSGDAVFLQQASDATKGIYMALSEPRGLLQYLMMAFLPDQRSRRHLVQPTRVDVDFRAACFCHRRVVDVGFVCSVCLSIFCEPPANADCLTCGTRLDVGDYGAKPAVVARKKKKKKVRANGPSGAATPTPTPTPGP
ncbi:TFIIH subunit Tfb4/p34 [Aspergillus taichungensis]|uniref:General transcription and DNA repair factor IIH subunit TFB4 n=1 Tax=Aspergillus taichungensis TaxID=482145 RepID=A0A2J5HPT9_9EURO|nr:TFIIH subunit Tfb4/p34 [Aspergillus taichungensis]